jgi:hypothetical protein
VDAKAFVLAKLGKGTQKLLDHSVLTFARKATVSQYWDSIVYALILTFTLTGSALSAELSLRWVGTDGAVQKEMVLDLAGLDQLPQRELATSTPWTTGKQVFTGPGLADLAALGPESAFATVKALNDYQADVPAEDWATLNPVVASRINAKEPPIYDKGPFWLVYPVDQLPVPLPQVYLSRMVWQINAVIFHVR